MSYYVPFGKLRSRPEFLELMSQVSEFLGSSCILTVQVKSKGQRFFLEHIDQDLRGGRDQFWLCIAHNAKFSACDGHCCCHVMSSTQNIFVVLQLYLKNKSLTVEGVHINEQWDAHESFSSSLGAVGQGICVVVNFYLLEILSSVYQYSFYVRSKIKEFSCPG